MKKFAAVKTKEMTTIWPTWFNILNICFGYAILSQYYVEVWHKICFYIQLSDLFARNCILWQKNVIVRLYKSSKQEEFSIKIQENIQII